MKTSCNNLLLRKYRSSSPLKTLWFLLSRNPGDLFWAVVFFVIKQSPVWILPIAAAKLIDAAAGEVERPLFVAIVAGAVMFVSVAQNLGTTVVHAVFFTKVRRGTEARLRSALLMRLQQLSMGFHENYQAGRTHAKVLRDVENLDQLVNQMVNLVLPAVVGAIVMMSVSMSREPVVALFFLGTIPIAGRLRAYARNRMNERVKTYRCDLEEMSARVSEMITMIPVTRAHNAEQVELGKMNGHLNTVRESGARFDISIALFSAMNWVSFQMFSLATLGFTCYLAWRGAITIGDVVMYRGFYTMLAHNVQSLMTMYPTMMKGFESIRSMGEILECPDIEHNSGKDPVEAVEGTFVFRDLSFRYDGARGPALHDLNLSVPAGTTVAIVGGSGAGKTTLVNLIIGFRRPTAGRLLLDGRDMNELDLRDYRRFLSVVSQETLLFNGTVRDNITYGSAGIDDQALREAITMANAREFIERLPHGLDTPIGERGARLSGGQKQRLAIARALIRDPRVIILDEATSALDVISEKLVQEAIDHLIHGRTTFIVAHRLSTIRNADIIVVLKDGRCVEQGPREKLLGTKGEFHRLYSLQV
jgi:ATP-binding cassette subfamily B protein